MGKKSLKKDRGYITATEWQTEWGGHKDRSRAPFKCLPFNCCAISFTPFEDPVCMLLKYWRCSTLVLLCAQAFNRLVCAQTDLFSPAH